MAQSSVIGHTGCSLLQGYCNILLVKKKKGGGGGENLRGKVTINFLQAGILAVLAGERISVWMPSIFAFLLALQSGGRNLQKEGQVLCA